MAKMKVHELAKELGIASKDVIDLLASKSNEDKKKTASSGLEDAEIELVKNNFGKAEKPADKPAAKPAEKKAEAPKAEAEKKPAPAPAKDQDQPAEEKKVKKIVKRVGADGKVTYLEKRTDENGKVTYIEVHPKKKPAAVYRVDNTKDAKQENKGNKTSKDGRHQMVRPQDGVHSSATRRPVRPEEGVHPSERHISHEPEAPVADTQTVAPAEEKQAEKPAAEQKKKDIRGNIHGNIFASGAAVRKENNGNGENKGRRNDNGNRRNDNRNGDGRRDDRNGSGDRNSNGRENRNGNGRNGGFNKNASAGGDKKERFTVVNHNNEEGAKNTASRNRKNTNGHGKTEHDALGKKQENLVNLEKNGGKKKNKPQNKAPERDMDEILTLILPEHLTIRELADRMKVQPSDIVKKLFMKGMMVTVNQEVDYEQAEEIALEFNCVCEPEEKVDVIAELLKEEEEDEKDMISRPPVVCVMGHVDHGKTSLLDAIRDTKVTAREAGGITQHIGAYTVSINDRDITFLDTPGHEAFTAMRMRGANSTDIAILVVAADDGVMPQTIEAINHAKAAGIEIIVAINKIDKPNANIDRVKQELSEYQLIPEDWGGSTVFVPVSAKTKEGVDTLLEMVLLTADVLELKANPNRKARGLVIEAQLDKGRGPVATVLVQKGTLHVGDSIAAGSCFGKVRAMIDDTGRRVKSAGPSVPVEILGLSDVPNAGEIFNAVENEKEARSYAETFISEGKNKLLEETKSHMSLDALFAQIQSGNLKELDVIVKADVQGSVEAVRQSLEKLSNDEVVVKVIHGGVGAINESDVILASASNAIIIGFNVRPDAQAKATAESEEVDVRLYKVIYDAIADVEDAMKGMLDPIFEEKVIGHAEIRQIFKASGVGNIAGSYILDGYFQRECKVRITREGEQIFEGPLASLKRFKDDVKEVKAGFECGLVFEGFSDIMELDQVEAYIMVEVPR